MPCICLRLPTQAICGQRTPGFWSKGIAPERFPWWAQVPKERPLLWLLLLVWLLIVYVLYFIIVDECWL